MSRFKVEIPAGRDPRVWMDGEEVSSVCRSITLFPGRCAIAVLLFAIEPETIEGELDD